ncbi:MAG TPA: hypothetical protein GXX34_11545 [Clostridia bacterium]|nr:hypothetical protein [Clostridia bacterium]
MDHKGDALLTKYLQVLGKSAGKEMENIRAKMGWSLAEDLWGSLETEPKTVEQLIAFLNYRLQAEFPFCERLELKEASPVDITVMVHGCAFKKANLDLVQHHRQNLCPVDPFLIFFLNRSFSQNCWLVDNAFTEDGCIMKFSLSKSCALK